MIDRVPIPIVLLQLSTKEPSNGMKELERIEFMNIP